MPSFVSIHTSIPNKEPVHAWLSLKSNQHPRNTRIKTFQTTRDTFVLLQVPHLAHWKVPDTRLQRFDRNMTNK